MKVIKHVVFWLGILVLLTFLFAPYYTSVSESFYFVSMLLPVVIGTNYFFNLILVPNFLLKKRYSKFVLYSIYMLIISLYLEMVVITLSFIFLAQYSYENMSPVSSDIFLLAVTMYFIVLLFSFIMLIKKSFVKETTIETLQEEKIKNQQVSFTIRSERQMKTLLFDEVLFIESLSDYIKVHLENGTSVISKEKISKLEEKLPECFVRTHRSFIVNKGKVTALNKEILQIGELELPISRTYRKTAWNSLIDKG